MTWAGTAIAVGTAAVGAVSANQQRKAQQKANQQQANIAAAQAQYSPWTGVSPSTPKIEATPDNTFGAAAQGALGGAMFANRMGVGKENGDDFKMTKEDKDFLNSPDAKPISPTSGGYVPMMDEMQREDDLAGFIQRDKLPRKMYSR